MAVELDEFTARQRAVWDAGDYAALSPYIADIGELVVDRVGIGPGMEVLDVACGTGNAARPAARAGARVTGLDLVPKLLEQGRAQAEADGLTIEWVEGDAEGLPFADGSFDRVLSTFGHMFAPHHEQTARELARVCRSGGAIVTATWTPEGLFGRSQRQAPTTCRHRPTTRHRPPYGAARTTWGSCSARSPADSSSSATSTGSSGSRSTRSPSTSSTASRRW
jgi:2-polyprenyl-3-methyl-5-hydroxy-6-metoxy-1,4-benzoquinol methylase